MMARLKDILISISVFVILLLIWYLVTNLKIISTLFLPSPQMVLAEFNTIKNTLANHILVSLMHFVVGLLPGIFSGVIFGIAVGRIVFLDKTIGGILNALMVIPRIAFLPFLILWIGPNEKTIIVLVALSAFFAVYITVFSGAKKVDKAYLETFYNLQGSRFQAFYYLILPATLPFITTGVRNAIARGFTSVIIAEMLLSKTGIGSLFWRASSFFQPELGFCALIILAVIAVAIFKIFDVIEKGLLPWKEEVIHR